MGGHALLYGSNLGPLHCRQIIWASQVALVVKNLPTSAGDAETQVWLVWSHETLGVQSLPRSGAHSLESTGHSASAETCHLFLADLDLNSEWCYWRPR